MYQEITSSLLFEDVMVQNGVFWAIGEQSFFKIILLYLIEG